ncbi:MAG: Hsp20/alpha crystallin family protein [Spirochaetota bacterium]|nr:Hsp20/alpha crystallin family protein [Spirochaetota bacterium]
MEKNIAKRDSHLSLNTFKNRFDKLFEDFFAFTPSTLFQSDWNPKFDMEEDEKSIQIIAEMPGIDEKDIQVSLDNNMLTISGEKKEEIEEKDKNKSVVFSERKFGSFSRSIAMPDGINTDEIKANFKKGILNINIPKEKSVKPKKIQIQVN